MLVILGNPPYCTKSKNNSEYILDLIKVYKEMDGNPVKEVLSAINDDYVKFIRFAEKKIEDSTEGILGIISNNGYLDNLSFKGMRYHLLKTFDEIYILNLHGNKRKNEKTDDGQKDKNIFDIQVGVAIAVFIKYKKEEKKRKLANVYYSSLKGKSEEKYNFLGKNSIYTTKFEKIEYKEPNYFFAKKDFSNENFYNKGLSLVDIFKEYGSGFSTENNKLAIDYSGEELLEKLKYLAYLEEENACSKYGIEKDSRNFNLKEIQKFLKFTNIDKNYVKQVTYRPFDNRFTYYYKSKGVVARPAFNIMKHMLEIKNNVGLLATKIAPVDEFKHIFITNNITMQHAVTSTTYIFPLYIKQDQDILGNNVKENFKNSFRNFINNKYIEEFSAEEILGYIYAVLHSNAYRTRFCEFLKIEHPRIIFVESVNIFKRISKLGTDLINSHLLENNIELDSNIGKHCGESIENSDQKICKVVYKKETQELFYNQTCCFKNIPFEVYEYMIGNFKVIRNYLISRKGRKLNIYEIEYLEKVIKALSYTIKKQKEIDKIILNLNEFGGQYIKAS